MKFINLNHSHTFPECYDICEFEQEIHDLEDNIREFWRNSNVCFKEPTQAAPCTTKQANEAQEYGTAISNDSILSSYLNFVLSEIPVYLINTSLESQKVTIKGSNGTTYADTIIPQDKITRPKISLQDIKSLNEDLDTITCSNISEYISNSFLKSDKELFNKVYEIAKQCFDSINTNEPVSESTLITTVNVLSKIAHSRITEFVRFQLSTDTLQEMKDAFIDATKDNAEMQKYAEILIRMMWAKLAEFDWKIFFTPDELNLLWQLQPRHFGIHIDNKDHSPEPYTFNDDCNISHNDNTIDTAGLYLPFGGDNQKSPKPEIFIWIDKISDKEKEAVLPYIIAHEFAHAMMDENLWQLFLKKGGSTFTQSNHHSKAYICNEEALATAIAWHTVSETPLAMKHILTSPPESQLGLSRKYKDKQTLQKQCIPLWIAQKLS